MKYYDCKVRLAGTLNNEVLKNNISAPEIQILRHMHGEDAVVEIKEVRSEKVNTKTLREHLKMTYTKEVEHGQKLVNIVDFLFPEGQPLPGFVVADDLDEEDEEDNAPIPPVNQAAAGEKKGAGEFF